MRKRQASHFFGIVVTWLIILAGMPSRARKKEKTITLELDGMV
jgi:hypothetical protein